MVGSRPPSVTTRACPGFRRAVRPRRRNKSTFPPVVGIRPHAAMACFPQVQADKTEAGFSCPSARTFYRWVLIWSQPALSLPSAAIRARRSDRRNDYGPSIPSAVLNHTVPSMVTSPLTVREWKRIRAGMWPDGHDLREKRLATDRRKWCGGPLDNGSAGTYLHISRGLLAALAGLNATA
jgi:hypothetical protein